MIQMVLIWVEYFYQEEGMAFWSLFNNLSPRTTCINEMILYESRPMCRIDRSTWCTCNLRATTVLGSIPRYHQEAVEQSTGNLISAPVSESWLCIVQSKKRFLIKCIVDSEFFWYLFLFLFDECVNQINLAFKHKRNINRFTEQKSKLYGRECYQS